MEVCGVTTECRVFGSSAAAYRNGMKQIIKLYPGFHGSICLFHLRFANRRKIRNKVGVIAVPFGDTTYAISDPVVDLFTKTLDYLEMRLIDNILVPGVTELGGVRTKKQVMAKCHELGRRLAIQGRH